jgi:integrating conjugative element protein (TIGR03758 family)
MAAPAAALSAFEAGAGVTAHSANLSISAVLCSLILFWLVWVVQGVGQRLLDARIKPLDAVMYIGRAAVVAAMVIWMVVG